MTAARQRGSVLPMHERAPLDTPWSSTDAGGRNGIRVLAPLRQRDFALLWSGMTISMFGDGIFLVALAWQVYQLSNSPAALSLVGLAMTVPQVLLLLFGGVLTDRIDRRRIMMGADVVRCVMIGALGVLSVTGALQLWHFVPLIAVYGAATAFFGPAFDAIIPDVVPQHLLTEANAIGQIVRPAALRLIGPAVGGFMIAVWGTGTAIVVDAATFVAGIVCVSLMRQPRRHVVPKVIGVQRPSVFADFRKGIRFVRRQPWLWGTFVAAAVVFLLFVGPSEVLVPYIVKNELHGSATTLGLVFAFGGLGAIGAALIVGQFGLPRRHMTFMYGAWTLSMLAVAGYGLVRAPWQATGVCLAFGAFESASNIAWYTTRQRFVPRAFAGRVSGLDWFVAMGLVPISFALTGPVAALIGVRGTLVGAGLLAAAIALGALFLLPGMRATERPAERAMTHAGRKGIDLDPATAA